MARYNIVDRFFDIRIYKPRLKPRQAIRQTKRKKRKRCPVTIENQKTQNTRCQTLRHLKVDTLNCAKRQMKTNLTACKIISIYQSIKSTLAFLFSRRNFAPQNSDTQVCRKPVETFRKRFLAFCKKVHLLILAPSQNKQKRFQAKQPPPNSKTASRQGSLKVFELIS